MGIKKFQLGFHIGGFKTGLNQFFHRVLDLNLHTFNNYFQQSKLCVLQKVLMRTILIKTGLTT